VSVKDKKELVFVCQVYHPDESSTSQLFTPLMEKFAKAGYSVSVLCGYAKGKKSPSEETLNGVKILRHGLNIDHKRGLVWRLVAYSSFILSVFFRLLATKNGPRFIGVTNPPFNAHVLSLTSKFRGRSFDYILLDLHPEGLVKTGVLKENSYAEKFWIRLNQTSYSKAERLYVIGRDMKKLVQENYSLPSTELIYMPHWSVNEGSEYIEFSDSRFTKALAIEEKFVVQYSGNMGLWHDMDTLVRAASKLLDQKHIQFVFVGGGMRFSSAQSLAEELECENIMWRDFVDESDLHESLSACHLALITLSAGLEGVAVPCKLYGILASGRAVLSVSPAQSEVALTLDDHKCGVNILPGEVDQIVEIIKILSKDTKKVREMGLNGFEACRTRFSIQEAYSSLVQA